MPVLAVGAWTSIFSREVQTVMPGTVHSADRYSLRRLQTRSVHTHLGECCCRLVSIPEACLYWTSECAHVQTVLGCKYHCTQKLTFEVEDLTGPLQLHCLWLLRTRSFIADLQQSKKDVTHRKRLTQTPYSTTYRHRCQIQPLLRQRSATCTLASTPATCNTFA